MDKEGIAGKRKISLVLMQNRERMATRACPLSAGKCPNVCQQPWDDFPNALSSETLSVPHAKLHASPVRQKRTAMRVLRHALFSFVR